MGLVQPHVRVGVHPHAADALPTVDEDDSLVATQVAAGCEEGIDTGEAGSHNADLAAFYRDVARCVSGWLGYGHASDCLPVPRGAKA
jgi:hypothetical protein